MPTHNHDDVPALAHDILSQHPGKPLKALWLALLDPATSAGPEVPMAIVLDARCGLNYQSRDEVSEFKVPGGKKIKNVARGMCTPITLAVLSRRSDVLGALLGARADTTDIAQDCFTLHAAAIIDNAVGLEMLAQRGVPMNVPWPDGSTPLHVAARSNSIASIKVLIGRGAHVNATCVKSLETPLMLACSVGWQESSQLLISKGAQVNMKNIHGNSALLLAIHKGHTNCVALLIANGATPDPNKKHWTPLLVAAYSGQVHCLSMLVEYGEDVNGLDSNGNSALRPAIEQGHFAFVEKLIALGADVHARFENGITPVHIAARFGRLDCLKLLASKGCDMLSIFDNQTPLQYAAAGGHADCISFFIEMGGKGE